MLNQKMAITRDVKQKSASVLHGGKSSANDLRAVRTRKRLDAAFVELLHRKAYGDIRVSDITRKARVGRATFYAHYPSKDELVRSQFSRIVAPMVADGRGNYRVDAGAFFQHMKSAPRLYHALMTSPQAGGAPAILRQCFESRLLEILSTSRANGLEPTVWEDVKVRFVAASLFVVIECWLNTGARETAEAMQDLFARLVEGGLPGVTCSESVGKH